MNITTKSLVRFLIIEILILASIGLIDLLLFNNTAGLYGVASGFFTFFEVIHMLTIVFFFFSGVILSVYALAECLRRNISMRHLLICGFMSAAISSIPLILVNIIFMGMAQD